MILPLLFFLLVGTSIADYRPSCRLCQETCSSTARHDSALCKCDAHCQVFGDCCGNQTPPTSCPASQLPTLQDGVMPECISTYLNPNIQVQADNEAFLIVSTCPDSWIETEGGITTKTCTNPTSATTLPPVTNTATGIVYRNEYCALCNGVSELVAWQTNLACNPIVYKVLRTKKFTEILKSDPDIFQRECHACAFQIPSIMTSRNMSSRNYRTTPPRSCIPRVRSCLRQKQLELITQRTLQDEAYALMEEKCGSGVLDLVIGTQSSVVYRNVDCAACNAENTTRCFVLQRRRNNIPALCFPRAEITTTTILTTPTKTTTIQISGRPGPKAPLPSPELPFTITLSNLGGSVVSISTKFDSFSISLDCPEGTAPVGLECRPTQCPEGYSEMGGRCSYNFPSLSIYPGSNITKENCSTGILILNETDYADLGNGTIVLAKDKSVLAVMDYDEFGRPLICIGNMSLDCPTPLVPLNESDYTHRENDSIIYKNRSIEVMFYDKLGRPLVCPNNTSTVITVNTIQLLAPLPGLQELTYIGCSLSILGAITILLTYSIFSEFRTLPGLILMNLCSTVLATNLVFLAGGPAIQSYPVKELCSSLAIILHFSYLSQFTWMSIFSFEMVRNFHRAKKLVMDSSKTKHQLFVVYLCIGWCLPVLITTTSITLNFSTEELVLYGVDNDRRIAGCWINHFESFIVAFLIPLILSLSCNIIMLLLTTFLLCQFSKDQSKLQKSNTLTLIRVWLATFSTTGLTWIFGFAAISNRVSWMWYPFVIFNSTQGLTIFLAFLFSKKILKLYLDTFTGKHLKKYTLSSTKNKTTITNHSKIGNKKYTTSMSTLSCGQVLGEERVGASHNGGGMSKECGVEHHINLEA